MIDLKSEARYAMAEELFFKLNQTEKAKLLEEFDTEKNLAVAYLAYKEAESAFKIKDMGRVDDFSNWVETHYANNAEMINLVKGTRH